MAKKINTTVLGSFVIVATGIAIAAIALFGSGRMFKHPERYVIFFSESIRGLNVGSPVRFHGIQIGTIVDMQAIYIEPNNKILTPIYVEIERERIRNLGVGEKSRAAQQAKIYSSGIRAQIVTDSIVTGQRAISLDMEPGAKGTLVGADQGTVEIASIPSSLEEISNTLESLPLEEIAEKFNVTLTAVEKAVTSPGFSEAMNGLGPALTEAREALALVSKDLRPLLAELHEKLDALDVEKTLQRVDRSLASIEAAAAHVKSLGAPGSPLDTNANRALVEIAAAARELRQVAELLQRRPEMFLTGKK